MFPEFTSGYGVVSSEELLCLISSDFSQLLLGFFSRIALGSAKQQIGPSRFGAMLPRRIFQKTP